MLPGTLQAYEESPIYCPHQRLPAALVQGHRQPRRAGRTAGRHRYPGSRPGIVADAGHAATGRGPTGVGPDLRRALRDLRKTDSVSQQEADQQSSGYQQSKANLAAADANVRRLEQLESFKNVYAPFSGVLTRRNVDPGALINAGAARPEGTVRHRQGRSASRLCQRAAGLCAGDQGRHEGLGYLAGISRARSSKAPWRAPRRPSISRPAPC